MKQTRRSQCELTLLTYPDSMLQLTALPLEFVMIGGNMQLDSDTTHLAYRMLGAMSAWGLVGLAAPQVNYSLQVVVADLAESDTRVFINPRIIESTGGTYHAPEGCGSLPGVQRHVPRFRDIVVEYRTFTGKWRIERFKLWDARILQHEIDHLNGILILDRTNVDDRQTLAVTPVLTTETK